MALEDAALLTQAQLDTLQFIDRESEHGYLYADVTERRKMVLNNLEKRGFIRLREEEGLLWAMPTAEGLEVIVWHVLTHSKEAYVMRGYDAKKAAQRRKIIEEGVKS